MQKIVIFLMLLSYCVARSINDGRDVLDTPMESIVPETSETEIIEEIVEENPVKIEPESSTDDEPINSDNTRFLKTSTTAATAAPVRPFTETIDLLLVLNSSRVTARK